MAVVTPGRLVRVEVHRGLPSHQHDRLGYNATRRQAKAWKAEDARIVKPKLRPLQYSNYPAHPPTEKGVDVALAVNAIEAKLNNRCDVAILFSHDTDLLPLPEAIAHLAGPEPVELASWVYESFRSRLRPKVRVAHHQFPGKSSELLRRRSTTPAPHPAAAETAEFAASAIIAAWKSPGDLKRA